MSNVIKFQAPFERLKLYDSSPHITLRKAIITQAIIDATNISNLPVAKKLEMEAKSWIFGNDESFKILCEEAELESSFVIKLTKEIIKLHRQQSAIKSEFKNKNNKIRRTKIFKN